MIEEHQLIPYGVSPLPEGPWLVFAPHPDDETFGMGGALLLAAQQGIQTHVVFLTNGALGGTEQPALVERREQEARAAGERLGLQSIEFWGEPDRGLRVTDELVARVAARVTELAPRSVFFPSPMELHPDHRAAAALVWRGLQRVETRTDAYSYEISVQGQVNRLIDISAVIDDKRAAMQVYATQLGQNNYEELVLALNKTRTFTLPAAVTHAEGLFAYGRAAQADLPAQTLAALKPYWASPAQADIPLVTVVVRTKDRPELLEDALQSVAEQTYGNIELLVVNDGGEDVREIMERFESQLGAVKYVSHAQSRGRSAAANAGLEQARGEYVIFLDDDDLFDPGHVAALVEALQQHQGFKAAYAGVRTAGAEVEQVFNEAYDPVVLRARNYIPLHALLFHRSLIEAGCRFDEELDLYEDWDFWLQLSAQTNFFHVDQVSATYRYLGASGVSPIRADEAAVRRAKAALFDKWRTRWTGAQIDEVVSGTYANLRNHLSNLEEAIRIKDTALQHKTEALAQQQAALAHKDEALAQQAGALEQRAVQLVQKDNHIHNLTEQIKQKDSHIRNLSDQIERLNEVASRVASQEQQLQAQQAALAHRQRELEEALQAMHRERHAAAQWRETSQRLESANQALMASRSWRITAPVRGLKRYWGRVGRWYRSRTHRMALEPLHQLRLLDGGKFEATGDDPHWLLRSGQGILPTRWVEISGRISADVPLRPVLYFSEDGFFSDQSKQRLALDADGRVRTLLRLPDHVAALRLDPMDEAGIVMVSDLTLRELGSVQVSGRLVWPKLRPLLTHPRALWKQLGEWRQIHRAGGRVALANALLGDRERLDYAQWVQRNATLNEADIAAIRSHIDVLAQHPTVSVLVPVYNTDERWLRAALDSVLAQLYPYWELCIADDASTAPQVRAVLDEYAARDDRVRVVYREENGHIAAASNSALELATGQYLALLDHDDMLAPHALYMAVAEFDAHPDAQLVYSDEDKVNEEGAYFDPYFKPDWNPLLLYGQNYLNHLSVYRTERVREVGGFRVGFEGSQDWDLALRVVEGLAAAQIRHIPHVLYHWRAAQGSTALAPEEKTYTQDAAYKALNEHFERSGDAGVELVPREGGRYRVRFALPDPAPTVSLIIPTRNGLEVLRQCVESLYEKTDYPSFELIIVDNQSDDPQTLAYFEQLSAERGVRVLRYDAPFNYSAINNFAVRHADGEVLGFLNNDLEIIDSGWLAEMVSHAVRPQNGAVGAMLYYPNDRIQHAGVIVGVGGVAGHAYVGKERGYSGQMDRARLIQNLSAVTAACLVVRRSVFDEVGGFEEQNLAVAFNDIDLCLRIRARGYLNVWTPYAELYHHESATRGYEDTPEKRARFRKEVLYMQDHWGEWLHSDPAYNPNLDLASADFSWAIDSRAQRPWRTYSA